jgi:threonine aldolase
MDADEFVNRWAGEGVLVNGAKNRRIRLITHHNISSADVEAAAAAARRVLG